MRKRIRRKNTIAGGKVYFAPRCGICQRFNDFYISIELVRRTSKGAVVRCRNCGNESYRQSDSALLLAREPEPSP